MIFLAQDTEDALQAIASMIVRSAKMQVKFAQGTSQYTLLNNRIKALHVALSLINDEAGKYTREDLQNAVAPLASLISKSEKAQKKVAADTWQHTMLEKNLNALYLASPLLQKALDAF